MFIVLEWRLLVNLIQISMQEIHISMQEGTLLVCRKSKEIRVDPKYGLKCWPITIAILPEIWRLKQF